MVSSSSLRGGVKLANDLKAVGKRIQKARRAIGMSQVTLAEKLDISVSHLSDIENGKTNYGIDIFMAITETLQISADKLLRTTVPEVNAVYEDEVRGILDGCTSAEKESLVRMLKDMKGTILKSKSSKN